MNTMEEAMAQRTRDDSECQAPIILPMRQSPPTRAALRCSDESAPVAHLDLSSSMSAAMMDMPIITNISSGPLSPGPSDTQHARACSSFVPPARPSSTPFSHPENRGRQVPGHIGNFTVYHDEALDPAWFSLQDEPPSKNTRAVQFDELPTEVHEAIADHLFGFSIAPTSSSAMKLQGLHKSWASTLRHSRSRELTNLALINKTWTLLIQQRVYRHIKLKATVDSIEDALSHFASLKHLASYVKHIEIWFPVFQPACASIRLGSMISGATSEPGNVPRLSPSGGNCTLEEIFGFIASVLPQAQVLTLEGGERRKAPKVVHYANRAARKSTRRLQNVGSVRTLVTRGQWNLMREFKDFDNILCALPNLEEWQGSYSKHKSKSYVSLAEYIPALPLHVTRLGICLENDYRREAAEPTFYWKAAARTHICISLGLTLPRLEHFSYTGRVCHRFFETAARLTDAADSRLRSMDVTVKNCCRDARTASNYHGSGSGIHDMGFIEAFEKLVMSAIRFLEKHKRLQYLRIRFVDLGMPVMQAAADVDNMVANSVIDSLLPPLNPYFLLRQQTCTGVWSEAIVAEMARVRPDVSFTELCENFGSIVYSKDGRMVVAPDGSRTRITSLKLSNYQTLANRITMH